MDHFQCHSAQVTSTAITTEFNYPPLGSKSGFGGTVVEMMWPTTSQFSPALLRLCDFATVLIRVPLYLDMRTVGTWTSCPD